jgi:hypothetical protein
MAIPEKGQLLQLAADNPPTITKSSGDGQTPTEMNERLARVEEAIVGFRHSQNIMLGGLGLIVAILVGMTGIGAIFSFYLLGRIDTLSDRVTALPSQINSELRDISKTLAQSITAAKQTPPQVILMPAPTLVPTPVPTPSPPSNLGGGQSGGGGTDDNINTNKKQ